MIVSLLNQKGGVGKTTLAVHVAAALNQRGHKVLLVDADPQGNVAHALGMRSGRTIRELMLGDALLAEVIVRDVRERLDVIPSTPSAFGLDAQLAAAPQRETILARRLKGLDGYDAVVIDCSPAMSLLTYNALLFASEVIVPIGMDGMAILGARQTLAGVREIRDLWPDRRLDLLAVLPTSVNATTNATRAAFDALGDDPELRDHLYRRGIRQCIDVTYAITQRQTIWEYAPKSRAAEDYDAFVEFVRGGDTTREHADRDAKNQKIQTVV